MRRAYASVEESKCPSAAGIVRVLRVPIPWQAMQPVVFIVFSHCHWAVIFSGIFSSRFGPENWL